MELESPLNQGSQVVVVGGGFTGLSAAWELANAGHGVTILEAEEQIGGLAGAFNVAGGKLERFYHHWFNNDVHITEFIHELGLASNLVERRTRTGMYYAKSFFRLSSPLDLLRFSPLPIIDRFRLAILVAQARAVRDWRALEGLTAREWLLSKCGRTVYETVWEPLMRGKFGSVADDISAVWLWNKLRLRGGSRDKTGNEVLLYYRGGFGELTNDIARRLEEKGVTIRLSCKATRIRTSSNSVVSLETSSGPIECDAALLTTPAPVTASILSDSGLHQDADEMERVKYLANICLILRLDRSLSGLYWINVNEPGFPFVGIIEHTNFEPPEAYGGQHIVYLSRYLPRDDVTYSMSDEEYLRFALPFVQKMFPDFEASWIQGYHVWRADFAQPVVERWYSKTIPPRQLSVRNLFASNMSQIYPEDRGTNYAVREGRSIGKLIAENAVKEHSSHAVI